MKPLSESLTELAAKVKHFEESSAATRQREGHEFEKTTAELRETAQKWWADTREAVEHQISVMRTDFEKWQADLKAQRANEAAQLTDKSKTTEPSTKN
ncbi:hypothetical protein GPX89_27190 [Nocardia sp. ET3-3]|uniref:Uncharacterized protein n=1 Tax=Nocardia terrae TaxID=2675851 RepID=A0A7K1V350_9NOCA|nr:hypothetical protein [Nocardia terrae]MVU80922.1 hypothetical protein [Nocardia terrae]